MVTSLDVIPFIVWVPPTGKTRVCVCVCVCIYICMYLYLYSSLLFEKETYSVFGCIMVLQTWTAGFAIA